MPMPLPQDQPYLLEQQYRDGRNLSARIALHQRFSTAAEPWFHWLYNAMCVPSEVDFLELGSGTGMFWQENLDRIPETWEVTLSDFSEGMLDDARMRLGGASTRFIYRVFDAQAIPFEDDSFDVVMANHMLYHVPDRPQALAEIRRVLKPGGVFYAATNGARHLVEIYDLLFRFFDVPLEDERPEIVFGLETGIEQLRPYFSKVELYRRANRLVVTEAEPLIAYILSMRPTAGAGSEQVERFAGWVHGELAAEGAIEFTVDGGLIVGRDSVDFSAPT